MDKTYCIFGDSVTQAAYVENGWVDQVRVFLEAKHPKEFVNLFNLGVGGDTTEDLLKRIEVESVARGPSHIIIAIGVNDTSYVETTPSGDGAENKLKKNIDEIIEKSRKFTQNILIIGFVLGDDRLLKPIPDGDGNSFDEKRVRKFNTTLKEMASTLKLPFVNLMDNLLPGDFLDGLHPNQLGHDKMFQVIKEYL